METADIIIIGAGIAGLSAAAALAPHARVLVLEAEKYPGTHATGRSAAIFVRNYGNHTIRALNDASAAPLKPYLSQRGVMTIATQAEEKAFEAFMEDSTAERITPQEACRLFPLLRPEAGALAALERTACDIDVNRLLQDHLHILRSKGGRLLTQTHITHLLHHKNIWRLSWNGGAAEAPLIINATGAWADETARMAGAAPIHITAYRRSAAILPMQQNTRDWPMILPATENWYAKPEAGQLMVSPAEEDPVAPMDAWADDMVIAEGLERFSQAVSFEITRVTHCWAGLRSFVPDRTPVVGFAADNEGFFWLAGQGGYGVQTSPALAGLTRDLILGDAPDLAEKTVTALSPNRFKK